MGHHEVLPEAVRDALFEADDPLAALNVQGILPHWPAHARVEEQVVCRRLQRRRRRQVCPERPERLDLQIRTRRRSVLRTLARSQEEAYGAEGGDLLDTLLIANDFIARRALLPEPEDPSEKGARSKGMRSPERIKYEHTCFVVDAPGLRLWTRGWSWRLRPWTLSVGW